MDIRIDVGNVLVTDSAVRYTTVQYSIDHNNNNNNNNNNDYYSRFKIIMCEDDRRGGELRGNSAREQVTRQ